MESTVTLLEYPGHPPKFSAMRSLSSGHFPKHSSFQMVLSILPFLLLLRLLLTAALAYLDSGKVKVKGIVNKTFRIDQWEECLESMRNKSAIKVKTVR